MKQHPLLRTVGNFQATSRRFGLRSSAANDGSSAKGFLVESVGLLGASDISSFGGWRRFQSDRVPV
ncbi:hypothetical protein FJ425_03605 [Mesorhizobium sp. B2-7-2]|nr:hypothetical protein FJ425_03605 [Mesorhizobium sp. B2-7-2]